MTADKVTSGTKIHGDGKEQARHGGSPQGRHDACYRTHDSEKEGAKTAEVKLVGSRARCSLSCTLEFRADSRVSFS